MWFIRRFGTRWFTKRKMNRRSCVNNPDCFCYICGKYMTSDQSKNMTKRLRVAYKNYFGCEIGDQTKFWAPHLCCTVCYSGLTHSRPIVQIGAYGTRTSSLGHICACRAQLPWKPYSRQLYRACGQLDNSLSAPRLPKVTKNAFLAFASHLLSVKYGSREWRTRWKIPPGDVHHGSKISRPLKSQHDGGLLLVFAESNRRGAQAETKKLYTLLNQAIVNLHVTKSPRLISQVNKHL